MAGVFGGKPKKEPIEQKKPRFRVVEEQILKFGLVYVVQDTETGVCYMTGGGSPAEFTLMVDEDGEPLTLDKD